MCPFRRYIARYEEAGLEGVSDKRLSQASHRRAPVDEVMRLVDRDRTRHRGWNVKPYHAWSQREGGTRRDTWVKNTLQAAAVVKKAAKRGAHRKRRERAPWSGMMLIRTVAGTRGYPGNTGI